MRTSRKLQIILGVASAVLAIAWAGPAPPTETTAFIQAIQQAPDPSAVVAAYAHGVALGRNDPNLHEAYAARMVELGLPEMAYHQAQALTTLQPNNGLAWGVVAYVNARRGEMPEAISAINLAGQFAPDNAFIQRTAGEIVAWYDIKAEKPALPENASAGLAKVRRLLEKQPAFTEAYNTARNAYQAQANPPQAPAQTAPSQSAPAPQAQPQAEQAAPPGYAAAAPPPAAYDPGYYYDWGPGWVEPAPWWWWRPVGFFGGFDFFPFSAVIVFDHHRFFHDHHFFDHDHHFFHDRDFSHDRFFHHDGLHVAFHDSNRAFFHRDGGTSFFGAAAQPNSSLALSLRANFHTASGLAGSNLGARGTTSGSLLAPSAMRSTMPGLSQPRSGGFAPSGMRTRQAAPSGGRRSSMSGPPVTLPSAMMPRGNPGMMQPAVRSWGGMPRAPWTAPWPGNTWARPGFRASAFAAPHMAPHPMMLATRGFSGGGFHRGMASGGGFHGGGGFRGGGMRR